MKTFAIASVLIALASSNIVLAHDKKIGNMDMKNCQDMKGMDMKGMKDMDMKSCMEMMNKDGEGKTVTDANANGTVHKATGIIKSVDAKKKWLHLTTARLKA
jgi:hypothetical protein